jgi:hypothetical protein
MISLAFIGYVLRKSRFRILAGSAAARFDRDQVGDPDPFGDQSLGCCASARTTPALPRDADELAVMSHRNPH